MYRLGTVLVGSVLTIISTNISNYIYCMTYTEQFIEDVIAGGWNKLPNENIKLMGDSITDIRSNRLYSLHKVLLDPNAWQAVGKTRGWGTDDWDEQHFGLKDSPEEASYKQWHRFIDHLTDGKTIEEALSAIE